MKKGVVKVMLALLITVGLVSANTSMKRKALSKLEGYWSTNTSAKLMPRDTVGPIPDIRALLGSPGKNIAVHGDTVVIIYGEPSGDPANIFGNVKVAISFDGGQTWTTHDLSTNAVRRIYPGVIWPENWAHQGPLFFWHEAAVASGAYQPSPVKVAWDQLWPNGLYNVVELPNSQDWNCWLPSADASGDTIIVFAANIFDGSSYYWTSYDGGSTWNADTFMTPAITGGWHDTPIPRIGSNGYVAVITDWYIDYGYGATVAPIFMESMDGGQTWIDTIRLWDVTTGGAPYDSAGGWWYVYDFVLDANNKPHIIWKFGTGDHEYGDVWYYTPGGGQPGAWTNWTATVLVGDGQGGTVATQPTIGITDGGVLVATYKSFFISGSDTLPDIGLLVSADGGATWVDTLIEESPDAMNEEAFEIPAKLYCENHNLHVVGSYTDNDTPDHVYFYGTTYTVGVEENNNPAVGVKLSVPGVVSGNARLTFSVPVSGKVNISVFDITGRKVSTLYNGIAEAGTHAVSLPTNLAEGVYLVKMNAGSRDFVSRFVVVK